MPAVVAAVGAVVGGAVASSAVVVGVLGATGAMVAGALASLAVNYLGAPKAKKSALASAAQGALLNTTGTVDAIPVLYGQRRVGGTLCFAEVAGNNNEHLHLIIAHCEGTIQAIDAIYLDNVLSTDAKFSGLIDKTAFTGGDSQTAATAPISATQFDFDATYVLNGTDCVVTYANHKRTVGESVTLDFTSGTGVDGAYTLTAATADTFSVAHASGVSSGNVTVTASKWTANHRLRGVAYSRLRLTYDRDVFHGLPAITVDISGRKLYDPRSGNTAFSRNPALAIRDYLTHARYGRALATADLDDASFIAAANYCDQTVTTPDGNLPRYTCNGLIDTDQSALDNLEALLSCCRGFLVFSGGKYRLLLDQPTVPTFAFTEDNIVGAWSIRGPDKRNRFNRVRATWFNPAREWQPDILVADSPTWRTEDNGLLLETRIELPFTTNAHEAKRLADMTLAQSRYGLVVSFRATIAGLLCEVGDVVTLTHTTPGWSAKPFRITRMALTEEGEVEVTAAEYDASVYTANPLTAPRQTETSNLPGYQAGVDAPGGLALATGKAHALVAQDGSITARILASWTAVSNATATGYEVAYKASADSTWKTLPTGAGSTSVYLAPVTAGTTYNVRVRATTAGSPGTWSSTSNITAIGGDLDIKSSTATTYDDATYVRASGSTTVTITRTAHGRAAGETVHLNWTSGGVTNDGLYEIDTATTDTFTVTTSGSAAASGNVTITAGERMEIRTNVIQVMDANGVLRVKLGDLSA